MVHMQGMIGIVLTTACIAAAYGQERLNTLPQLDGLSATMMDEAILMREPLLKRYWGSVATFSDTHCRDIIRGNNDALQVRRCHNSIRHISVVDWYLTVLPRPPQNPASQGPLPHLYFPKPKGSWGKAWIDLDIMPSSIIFL